MIFCVSLIKENSCKAHSSLDSQMKPKLQPPQYSRIDAFLWISGKNTIFIYFFIEV